MIDAISSIASSLASATVLTKAVLGMKVDQEVITKVSALQSEIMTAQSAALTSLAERAALMARVDELEKALKLSQSWDDQVARYRMIECQTGAHIYLLREEFVGEEPSHRLCPNCFLERRKSILQTRNKIRGGEVVGCPKCGLQLELVKSQPRPAVSTTTLSGW